MEANFNQEENILQIFVQKHSNLLESILFCPESYEKEYKENYFQKSMESLISMKNIKSKIKLPIKDPSKKKTIFIDIDETLVYLDNNNPINQNYKLLLRPYSDLFFEEISKHYEIFIFTAGSTAYAWKIAAVLDPENKYIDGIIDRNDCLKTKYGFFIKDVGRIINREQSEIILIDNNFYSFGSTLENGIPIVDFQGNEKDCELLYLTKFLVEICNVEDVRVPLKERYNFDKILKYINDYF